MASNVSGDSEIYFFDPAGENGWLVNLSLHPVTVFGRIWPTAEHAYQAAKFIPHAMQVVERIYQEQDPFKAKAITREAEVAKLVRENWYPEIGLDAMRHAVYAKFTQHEELKQHLLATGSRLLIERTGTDPFWAVDDNGNGENWAGRIVMQVRDAIRDGRPLRPLFQPAELPPPAQRM